MKCVFAFLTSLHGVVPGQKGPIPERPIPERPIPKRPTFLYQKGPFILHLTGKDHK